MTDYDKARQDLRDLLQSLPENDPSGFTKIEVHDGTVIIEQGKSGSGLFQIVSGGVRVEAKKDGQMLEVAYLEEGDFFGEISLITGQPANASCIAEGSCTLNKLSDENFEQLMNQHPDLHMILSETARNRRVATRTELTSMHDYNHSGLV